MNSLNPQIGAARLRWATFARIAFVAFVALLLTEAARFWGWKTQPQRLFERARYRLKNPVPRWVRFAENVPLVSRIADRFHPKTETFNFAPLISQVTSHPRRDEPLGLVLKNILNDDRSSDLFVDFEILGSLLPASPETVATLTNYLDRPKLPDPYALQFIGRLGDQACSFLPFIIPFLQAPDLLRTEWKRRHPTAPTASNHDLRLLHLAAWELFWQLTNCPDTVQKDLPRKYSDSNTSL